MPEPEVAAGLSIPFSYAFQPIVDVTAGEIFSYEALIRGPRGEPAPSVFASVPRDQLHRFDRESRVTAVRLAGRLGIETNLNVNALPGSLFDAAGEGESLLDVAGHWSIAPRRLILEVTEEEAVEDSSRFTEVVDEYRALGVRLAIDDFGAGYSGLNLLADFQPDLIKLDMKLVRGIQSHGPRQSIARAIALVCGELGIEVVAEGIETIDEFLWLRDQGVELFQGYLFAKPAFELLGDATIPEAETETAGSRLAVQSLIA